MFVRRVRAEGTTYYYLVRRNNELRGRFETLARIGSLKNPTKHQELSILSSWVKELLSNGTNTVEKRFKTDQEIKKAKERQLGRGFNYDQCMNELRHVYRKYGMISKLLLEKKARPNGEISWGVQTIFKNLKRRGKTLNEVFCNIRREKKI